MKIYPRDWSRSPHNYYVSHLMIQSRKPWRVVFVRPLRGERYTAATHGRVKSDALSAYQYPFYTYKD